MVIWESAPLTSAPALTIGRAFLAVAAVALAMYSNPRETVGAAPDSTARPRADAGDRRSAEHRPGAFQYSHEWLSMHRWLLRPRRDVSLGGAAVLAVIAEPKSAVTLLGAVGLGCVLAGIFALAGVHSEPAGSSMSTRLLGTYGNPNFLAATQALALPLAIAALFVERGIGPGRIRWLAVAAIAVLIVTVFQTYSRSGLLAAAGGSYVTIVLLVPTAQRRRTAVTSPRSASSPGSCSTPASRDCGRTPTLARRSPRLGRWTGAVVTGFDGSHIGRTVEARKRRTRRSACDRCQVRRGRELSPRRGG